MATVKGRIGRAACYLEPEVYVRAQAVADKEGDSLSSWVRKLILTDLVNKGQLTQEQLLKLATQS